MEKAKARAFIARRPNYFFFGGSLRPHFLRLRSSSRRSSDLERSAIMPINTRKAMKANEMPMAMWDRHPPARQSTGRIRFRAAWRFSIQPVNRTCNGASAESMLLEHHILPMMRLVLDIAPFGFRQIRRWFRFSRRDLRWRPPHRAIEHEADNPDCQQAEQSPVTTLHEQPQRVRPGLIASQWTGGQCHIFKRISRSISLSTKMTAEVSWKAGTRK